MTVTWHDSLPQGRKISRIVQSGRDRDKEATNKIGQNDKNDKLIIGLHHYLTYNPPMVLSGRKKNLTPYSDLQSPSPLQSLRFLLPLSPCPQDSNNWSSFKCFPTLGPFPNWCFSLDPNSFTPSFSNRFYSLGSLLKSHLLRQSLGPSI